MPLYWLDPLGLYLDYPTKCFRVGPTDEAIGRVAQNPHIPTDQRSLAVASMKAWQCVLCLYEWGPLRMRPAYGPQRHGYTKAMLICGRMAKLIGSHATEDVPYKIGPILGWELSGPAFAEELQDELERLGVNIRPTLTVSVSLPTDPPNATTIKFGYDFHSWEWIEDQRSISAFTLGGASVDMEWYTVKPVAGMDFGMPRHLGASLGLDKRMAPRGFGYHLGLGLGSPISWHADEEVWAW
jgi:hypothetical protein